MKTRDSRKTETRLLESVLGSPGRLRERLVLALALSPPKARRGVKLHEGLRRTPVWKRVGVGPHAR